MTITAVGLFVVAIAMFLYGRYKGKRGSDGDYSFIFWWGGAIVIVLVSTIFYFI